MRAGLFVSYGQNNEDVVLWRALGSEPNGFYVDVGAGDPTDDSVTKAFYDRGWRGINVEPMPSAAETLRAARPHDITVQAAVTTLNEATTVLREFAGTGLSTLDAEIAKQHVAAGFVMHEVVVSTATLDEILKRHVPPGQPIHFLKIDVEGAESDVLRSLDLATWRPWVVVVEATAPNSTVQTHHAWEGLVVDAGYQFCLFDGVSRFYVADERASDLGSLLSYPACVFDGCVPASIAQSEEPRQDLLDDVIRWRTAALERWVRNAGRAADPDEIQVQLAAALRAAEDAREALDASDQELAGLRAEVGRLRDALVGAHSAVSLFAGELDRTHRTVSWRVTRPLRFLRRLFTTRRRVLA